MGIRLLFALAVLVFGQLLQMRLGANIGPRPGVDRAAISIRAVRHGAMPLHHDGQIENATYMERGFFDQANSAGTAFRLAADGHSATRVPVRFGTVASELIEIKEGLHEGDRVIVSDMSRWSGVDRVFIE
jgi:hypothetical protein